MKSQVTFTSTLPKNLMQKLTEYAENNQLNKKEIIVKALENYFDEVKRAAYEESFKKIGKDPEQIAIANEGIADYLKQLNKNL
jgi:metal-responsive CopG/Arc/MetJ family transcriptional regulator